MLLRLASSRAFQVAVVLFSALYAYLLNVPAVLLPFAALAGGWMLWMGMRKAAGQALERRAAVGSACLALLFLVQLPLFRLTSHNRLKAMVPPGSPGWLVRVVNLGENLLVAGTALVVLTGLVYWAWLALRRWRQRPAVPQPVRLPVTRVLLYALPGLLVWSLFLAVYWPGLLSPDSMDQWRQAHFLTPLNDWHPVAHTLLVTALTRVWDTPAAVAICQILALGLTWGWMMRYFETRGAARGLLWAFSLVFALLPSNAILVNTLWKDVPYAIACLGLVFLLGRVWATGGAWLAPRRSQALLGVFLALPYLFRHNGLLVPLLGTLVLLAACFQRWRAVAVSAGLALALTLAVRGGLAFGLLGAQPAPEGLRYTAAVQHIGAVIYHDGRMTAGQAAAAERLMPLEVWKAAYSPYSADQLTKPWGMADDPQILDRFAENRSELLRLFAGLSLANPGLVGESVVWLNLIQWEILNPIGDETVHPHALFLTESVPAGAGLDPARFAHPNAGAPLKEFLDDLLVATADHPLSAALIWRGGIWLWLTIALGWFLIAETGWRALLLVTPALANSLSLLLAMTTQDFRYVYPNVLPVAVILLFCCLPEESLSRPTSTADLVEAASTTPAA